jgi:carboxyl-terminal processing protease
LAQSKTENINPVHSKGGGGCFLRSLLFFFVLVLSIGLLSAYVLSDKNLYYSYRLTSTLDLVSLLYPEKYDSQKMINQARQAIFDELDRYCGYVEPEMLNRLTEEFSGAYSGLGITVVPHDSGLQIMSVRENGPAGKAGMVSGDIIIEVDSVILAGMSNYKASFLLRGKEGTEVGIVIRRKDIADRLHLRLTREKIRLLHIPYAGLTENKILYIRITDFEAGLADDLYHVLDSLCLKAKSKPAAILLDLKGNPGGLLSQAVTVTDMFLNSGRLIVGIKGRSRWKDQRYFSSGGDLTNNLPMAILVDRGSASAAEIVAGSLKYANRAILIGDTTFGKGLVQEYDYLSDGSGVRLTIARYFFEGGIYLNDPEKDPDSSIGIAPDFYFKFVSDRPFIKQLESSFLLRDFALKNKSTILDFAPFSRPDEVWFEDFIAYSKEKDFKYVSDINVWAQLIRDEIVYGHYSDKTFQAINRICRMADADDNNQIYLFADYIRQRLYHLALEAEAGAAVTYRDAIVPYRSDIIFAEKILMEKQPN